MKGIIAAICLLICAQAAFAKSRLSGEVRNCNDGDTCRISIGTEMVKVRISGIDAPETKQPQGRKAKDFLNSIVLGEKVELDCDGRSYDRRTCLVFHKGKDVGLLMVEGGWAFEIRKFSKGKYTSALNKARKAKKGMWATSDLQSPHCFRHPHFGECKKNALYEP